MLSRPLGNTGLTVSEIGLGTAAYSGLRYGTVEKSACVACVERYLTAGGNFIDTARSYGDSENFIGEVLSAHGARSAVVLATKTTANTKAHIESQVAESCKAMRTDWIDVLYLHRASADPATMETSVEALRALKSAGTIRATAMSVPAHDVDAAAIAIARQYLQSGLIDVMQIVFSMFRQGMSAVFDEAKARGVGLVARGVLENGFLSGKYEPGARFTDHRSRWTGRRVDRLLALVADARVLVKAPYQSLPEVATRFVLDSPPIVSVLGGARLPEQLEGLLNAAERPPLPPEVVTLIRERYARYGTDFNQGHWSNRWVNLPKRVAKRLARLLG